LNVDGSAEQKQETVWLKMGKVKKTWFKKDGLQFGREK
jgi:hypothetical protein